MSAIVVGRAIGKESQEWWKMKTSKHRRITPVIERRPRSAMRGERSNTFKRALSSYADRFAREPHLSFEQHLFRLAANSRLAEGEERRRG